MVYIAIYPGHVIIIVKKSFMLYQRMFVYLNDASFWTYTPPRQNYEHSSSFVVGRYLHVLKNNAK